MQLKVESEMPSSERAARGQDRCNRTSSVYISNGSSVQSSNNSDVLEHQKPVLTIQVNQNQNNNSSNNETANNLVNIVSCFRATTTAAITHNGSSSNGIENLVHKNSNLPFNVSVNKNYDNNSSDRSEESLMNNKNNQNIVNIVENYDPNEITIAPNVTSTVDYSNVTLVDQSVGLIAEKIDSNAATAAAASESVINQITIVNDNGGDTIAVESVNNQNAKVVDENSQTFREQRRRERRERRQARQRAAQHGHHRHHMSMVHSSSRTNVSRGVNGMEQSTARVNGYEMLPDIINNHLPPPYSTLPIHQIPPSLIPTQPPPSHLPPPPPIITAAPLPVVVDDCRFSFPIPIIRRSPSEHSGRKGCCGQFFHSPKSLGLIAMIALGGVACALGGAAWGASGLAGQPSTHLTVSLLMIGIGVVLVTISGVAWRITTADGSACFSMEGTEFDHCGRQQCLRNNSMSHGLLYPEFQHRQPPPTYQASMQEYRLRLLLLDRDRSHGRRIVNAVSNPQSSSSPPPTYRSNTGSQLRSNRGAVITNPNGPNSIFSNNHNNSQAVVSGIENSEISPAASYQLNAVPSKEEARTSNSIIKLTTSSHPHTTTTATTTITPMTTQINHKNGRQQVLINHSTASDVSNEINLHHQSQVKVNSCESNLTVSSSANEIVTASSLCNKNNNSFNSNNNDSGMITIVTINNDNANNDDRRTNNNSIV